MGVAAEQFDEPPHGGGERLAAGMDDAQRPDEFFVTDPHAGERAGRHLAEHGRLRQERHAGVDLDRPLDRLDVVELHDDIRLHAACRQHPVDFMANDKVGIEAHHRLAFEGGKLDRLTSGERMPGGADKYHRLLPPRLRMDGPRAPRITDDTDIGLAMFHGLQHPLRVEVFEANVGLGVLAHEFLEIAAHVVESD